MKVLVTGQRSPAGCHLADQLSGDVIRADCIRYSLRPSLVMPQPQEQFTAFQGFLEKMIVTQSLDCVIATCEDVIHTAQALEDMGRHGIFYGPPSSLAIEMHDKLTFVRRMQKWGLPVPATCEAWDRQEGGRGYVFKKRFSRFASDVRIDCETAPEEKDGGWIRQDLCKGIEVCVYALAFEGKLMGFQAYRPVVRAGVGAGIGLRPVFVPGLEAYLIRFMEKADWHGQVAFDCFYDGDITFIECNPRTTSGVHWFGDISPALRGHRVLPVRQGALQVSAAMPIFGERTKRYHWARRAPDVMARPLPLGAQWRTAAELSWRGLRQGKGLIRASTWGIEHSIP